MLKHPSVLATLASLIIFCAVYSDADIDGSAEEDLAVSATAEPEWWSTEKEANRLLFQQKRSIVELTRRMIDSDPKNAHEAMFKITDLIINN